MSRCPGNRPAKGPGDVGNVENIGQTTPGSPAPFVERPAKKFCESRWSGRFAGRLPGHRVVTVAVMVHQPRRIEFDTAADVRRHLDRWAADVLTSPEAWATMAQRAGQWVDYSPRNQVLLASYGIATPVAGASTWEQVPSIELDRPVAIAAGEHGLPVRVPIIQGDATDVASSRIPQPASSTSAADGFEWRPVYAVEQLARRPIPDALTPAEVPNLTEAEWAETFRQASGPFLGGRPRTTIDPYEQAIRTAAAVRVGSELSRLGVEHAAQAGWLVTDRVGLDRGPMPDHDPTQHSPTGRWQRLVAMRTAVDQMTTQVGRRIGVDLNESPIPKWDTRPDTVIAPGRRNFLSRAEVNALAADTWTTVGPYSAAEWSARGREGARGTAEFLRVTDRSYLAVYETAAGTNWSIETAGRGPHLGMIDNGQADTINAAKADALDQLRARFPDHANTTHTRLNARTVDTNAAGWTVHPAPDPTQAIYTLDISDRVSARIEPNPNPTLGWDYTITADGITTDPLAAGELSHAQTRAAIDAARATAMLAPRPAPDAADTDVAIAANATLDNVTVPDVDQQGWLLTSQPGQPDEYSLTITDRVSAAVQRDPDSDSWIYTVTRGDETSTPSDPIPDHQRALTRAALHGSLTAASDPAGESTPQPVALAAAAAHRDTYSRSVLIANVSNLLTNDAVTELRNPTIEPDRLIGHLADAGVRPNTIMAVLSAEGFPAETIAEHAADIAAPTHNVIEHLHDRHHMSHLGAAKLVGASLEDLDGITGITPAQRLAYDPDTSLRRIPDTPDAWARTAAGLIDAGLDDYNTLQHLARNAPSPETLAAAADTVTNNYSNVASAVGDIVPPEDLATIGERYGLNPHQTIAALDGAVDRTTVGHVALELADGDPQLAADLAGIDVEDLYTLTSPAELTELHPHLSQHPNLSHQPDTISNDHDIDLGPEL